MRRGWRRGRSRVRRRRGSRTAHRTTRLSWNIRYDLRDNLKKWQHCLIHLMIHWKVFFPYIYKFASKIPISLFSRPFPPPHITITPPVLSPGRFRKFFCCLLSCLLLRSYHSIAFSCSPVKCPSLEGSVCSFS